MALLASLCCATRSRHGNAYEQLGGALSAITTADMRSCS